MPQSFALIIVHLVFSTKDRAPILNISIGNAHPLLVGLADTVTEMREVKHAYQKGILAQRGIEF